MTLSVPIKRIAVTGSGGQIAYNLLFRIASGELFGVDQPIALHLLEVPAALDALQGVLMELEDCAFPLLKEIRFGSDVNEIFGDVDLAILIGAKPRGAGMERKDLLSENGKIFALQGEALNRVASRDVLVFVVGNPCNTNCLIALSHAPDLRPDRFFAMTRLDENRARSALAKKAGVCVEDVSDLVIWGNHSSTQVPDFFHAKIKGKPAADVIQDRTYLEETLIAWVQKRGAQIIAARGKSSAASATQAIIDSIQSLYPVCKDKTWFSCGVLSDGNPYGIPKGLVFSFPCQMISQEQMHIVSGLQWNPFLKEKIAITEKELLEERDLVSHLLKRK